MKRFLSNLALIFLSTALSLLAAEALLRVINPQQLGIWYTLRDGTVIHPPGFDTYMMDFKQYIHFNSIGMRDREHTVERARDGGFRILVLGDSFMEAQQVAFEESFPSLLEHQLTSALGRKVEVINCSVSGWAQDEELVYLDRYGKRFMPDLVLVAMTLHNDVQENLEEQYHSISEGKLRAKLVEDIPLAELAILRVKQFLSSHSHLWQLARKYKYAGEIRQKSGSLDQHVLRLLAKNKKDAELEKGWKLTFELFSQIRDVGARIGARTVVMLIPLRIQLEEKKRTEFLASQNVGKDEIELRKPQDVMTVFGRVAGIDIIDLSQEFRDWTEKNQASLHLPEGHWNTNGHRLAAEVAASELARPHIEGSGEEAVPRLGNEASTGEEQ